MKEQHEEMVFEFPGGKVQLDASAPVPFHLEIDLVDATKGELSLKWGSSPHREENGIPAFAVDQTHKTREAERLTKTADEGRMTLMQVAKVTAVEEATKTAVRAIIGVILLIAIKYAGIL